MGETARRKNSGMILNLLENEDNPSTIAWSHDEPPKKKKKSPVLDFIPILCQQIFSDQILSFHKKYA